MRRRYIIAAVVGVAIGLIALFFVSNPELFFYHSLVFHGFPSWEGYENLKPGPLLDLQHKAILLRFCSAFVDRGFLFTGVPAFLACGLVKLEQLGKNNESIASLCAAIKASLILCLVGLAVGLGYALVADFDPTHRREVPTFEVKFFELVGCGGLFVSLCLAFVVMPAWCIGTIAWLLAIVFPKLAQRVKHTFDKQMGLPK